MGNSAAEMFGRSPRVKAKANGPAAHQFVLPEQLMGIEIEAEATDNAYLPSSSEVTSLWEVKSDASLMHGQEYVLRSPLAGDLLSQAISSFFRRAEMVRMATSSTHIHLDMEEEHTSPATVQLVFALVYTLENVLWHVGDVSRQWCGFTHPLRLISPVIVESLFSEGFRIRNNDLITSIRHSSRYFGLNVQALTKYGSLEFRYFPTATSAEELAGWVNLVQSFKNAALSLGTMRALASVMATEAGYNQMITSYFAPWERIIRQHVPYEQASKLFDELTDLYKGNRTIDRDYSQVAASSQGFSKIAKKKVRRAPPESPAGVGINVTAGSSDTAQNYADIMRDTGIASIYVDAIRGSLVNLSTRAAPSAGEANARTVLVDPHAARIYVAVRGETSRSWNWVDISSAGASGLSRREVNRDVRHWVAQNINRLLASGLGSMLRVARAEAAVRNIVALSETTTVGE